MKIFFLTFCFFLPLFGEVLDDAAIQERIEKATAVEDYPAVEEAAKVWAEALEASKVADAASVNEKEFQVELARLDSLKPLELPQAPEGELSLAEQEVFLKTMQGSI